MAETNPSEDPIASQVDALLENRLDPAEARRLEELVCSDPAARRTYLRYIHLHCSISPHRGMLALPREDGATDEAPADVMSETLVMPALRSLPDSDEPAPIVLPVIPPRARERAVTPFRRPVFQLAAAVLLAACIGIGLFLRRSGGPSVAQNPVTILPATTPRPSPAITVPRPQVVAHVTALAPPPPANDPRVVRPGATLVPGQTLRIPAGAAEITFKSGVVLVAEGPATLRIVDDNAAELEGGKVCARVPHAVRGFRVVSSKLTITDLGTEFGLSVDPRGEALADVFEGRVTVALGSSSPSTPAEVHVLDKGQAVQCPVAGGGPVRRVTASPVAFTRDIARLMRPIPLHSTGAGIAEGDPDPHWLFVADSNDPSMKPRPATVATAFSTYLPNGERSRWISTADKLVPIPAGTYTFRTTVDLTGFSPGTVKLLAHVAADDGIGQIRVNGHAIDVPPVDEHVRQFTGFHDLVLPADHFVAGRNTVEIDVPNSKEEMALRVEWEGTAAVPVLR